MVAQAIHILLVEDDEIDGEAIRRAFRQFNVENPIMVARDGLEALEILRGENGQDPLPRPFLILLDLNMPRMNGLEFLEEVRKDLNLHDSVVFVLTTSSDDRDKLAAYDKNIAGYLVKSEVGENFENLMELLHDYLRYVAFPPER